MMYRALVENIPVETVGTIAESASSHRVAELLGCAIYYSLLVLIATVAIPYGTVEPWWEAVFECMVFLLTAASLVEGWVTGLWRVSCWPVLLPIIGLIVFAYLQTLPLFGSTTISADPFNTQRFALKLLSLALVGVLLLRYTSSLRRLRTLVYVVIGVAVSSAIFGLLRQTIQGGASDFILPYLPPWAGYGQFINRNHFAFLMELGLGLTLGLMVGRKRWLIGMALSLPLWMALVLSNSRGGIFSMLCQVLFVALLCSRSAAQELVNQRQSLFHRSKRVVLTACLLAVIVGGTVWVGGDPLINRLETTVSEVSDHQAALLGGIRRTEVWAASWTLGKAHWLAGVGFGGYWSAIPQYHQASGKLVPQEAHNDYLELLASGGLIGCALTAWFVIAFLYRARRSLLEDCEPMQRAARLGSLAALFAVAVHSIFDFGLHVTINALLVTALAVITITNRLPNNHN